MTIERNFERRLGKVGFVVGPGGTRGAWGAGAFIPFKDFGIMPDFVVSCSVGTLNAAGLVESDDLTKAARTWRKYIRSREDIFEHNPGKTNKTLSEIAEELNELRSLEKNRGWRYNLKLARLLTKILYNRRNLWETPNLLSPRPLVENVLRRLDMNAILNSPIEFEIVCGHKSEAQKTVFSNRTIRDPEKFFKAILASISISGIFPPLEIDGEAYIDAHTLPIYRAVLAHCKTIFVFCMHPADEAYKNEDAEQGFLPIPKAGKSFFSAIMDLQFTSYQNDLIEMTKAIPADVYILRPQRPIPKRIETLFTNPKDRDWLIEDGRRTTQAILEDILPPLM